MRSLPAGSSPRSRRSLELLDGYGYRFPSDGSQLEPLLEFIAAERRCCPFLTFELAFEPHGGPLWLRMRGSPQVKAFIAEAFNTRLALLPSDAPSQVPRSPDRTSAARERHPQDEGSRRFVAFARATARFCTSKLPTSSAKCHIMRTALSLARQARVETCQSGRL